MSPVLIAGLIALGLTGILVALAVRAARRARRIAETPTSRIKDLVPGFREVKGRVGARSPLLTSPLSERRCVYYRFVVEEKHSHAGPHGGGSHWKTVVEVAESVLCVVDDGTGEVEVELARAELKLATDAHDRSGFLNDAPANLERTLNERYGRSSRGWVFNKEMRYTETVLAEGDQLYVIGTVSKSLGGGARFTKGDDIFVVSDMGEQALGSHYRNSAILFYALSALSVAGGAIAVIALARHR